MKISLFQPFCGGKIPFHVQWYYEGWEEKGGLTQPGVLMIEEDVFNAAAIYSRLQALIKSVLAATANPKTLKKIFWYARFFRPFFPEKEIRADRDSLADCFAALLFNFGLMTSSL